VTSKPKILVIAILALLILSISAACVAAQSQYTTEKTTNVTIGSDGSFTATEPDVGVTYQILGVPGSTGTVTAGVYNGNPQPTASVPSGISLTDFIGISFNIPASDFTEATVTLNYTASEVQNIQSPYTVYKYDSSSNSYVALSSTVDTTAKTIAITLNSLTDPLLAIGGLSAPTKTSSPGIATSTWIVIVVSAIVIVVLIVFVVSRLRRREEIIVVPPSGDVKPRPQPPQEPKPPQPPASVENKPQPPQQPQPSQPPQAPQSPTKVENKPQAATPNNQERNHESNNLYSLIAQSTKTPSKPEKSKISVTNKPKPPISKTPEDKTARINAEKKQQPVQPKKEKKQNKQNQQDQQNDT